MDLKSNSSHDYIPDYNRHKSIGMNPNPMFLQLSILKNPISPQI